jgi:oxygen-dependent protoporphyrinogen oxidase
MKRIAIIGGGISGLVVLHYLKQRYENTVEINLYERSAQLGGAIASLNAQGFLFETGPNGFLTNQPNTLKFLEEIAFSDQLIEANKDANRRYVQMDGQLHLLPMDPLHFISSSLLSTQDKFRLIQGAFIKNVSKNQSVYDYCRERFGLAVTERLVDPFLTGVYAGDIKRLHMDSLFPKRQKKSKARLCSFKNGMGSLIHYLADLYKPYIKTGVEIKSLEDVHADQVICSTPAYVASSLLGLDILNQIPYSPVAVVGLLINKSSLRRVPDGFGYLVPSKEGKDILGVLLESNVFHRSSQEDRMFIRVMLGGAHHLEILKYSQEELKAKAIREIDQIYGLNDPILEAYGKVWSQGIPQYEGNYPVIYQGIKTALQKTTNVHICANYLDGISFNDCIKNARKLVYSLEGI